MICRDLSSRCVLFGLFLTGLFVAPQHAGAGNQTVYRFERMWPTLQQPWYFNEPSLVEVSPSGDVIVTGWARGTVASRFSRDMNFLESIDLTVNPSQAATISRIALDDAGNYFVVQDVDPDYIHKFDAAGRLVETFGGRGRGAGQFDTIRDLQLSKTGHLLVLEQGNLRVQRFDPSGAHAGSWSLRGSGSIFGAGRMFVDDQNRVHVFTFPPAINVYTETGTRIGGHALFEFSLYSGEFVHANGKNYVLSDTGRVMTVYSEAGQYLDLWQLGTDGFFGDTYFEGAMSLGASGELLVCYSDGNDVQAYSPEGVLLNNYSSSSDSPGSLNKPGRIAVAPDGTVFVMDEIDVVVPDIHVFDANGRFVRTFPAPFLAEEIAVLPSGELLIATESALGRYSSLGAPLGSINLSAGGIGRPRALHVANDGRIFVADGRQVAWFTGTGVFQGGFQFNGALSDIRSLAWRSGGPLYLLAENNSLTAVSLTGEVQWQRGESIYPARPGRSFPEPQHLAVAANGALLVIDSEHDVVHEIEASGTYLRGIGGTGIAPGQFSGAQNIAVHPDHGALYVADTGNNRIQVLRPVETGVASKAIIIAGGGPYEGNALWSATRISANFAYRTLLLQGFTNDDIRYLSDGSGDIDGNGLEDDIDAACTLANIEHALSQWLSETGGAGDLVIYLVDHGGPDVFRVSGGETLSAAQLAAWVNVAAGAVRGTLTVVYDACQSGSFLDELRAPERIVLASATALESAYFLSVGTISFSSYFWNRILAGSSVGEAFDTAHGALAGGFGLQTPQIADPQGLAPNEFIGNSLPLDPGAPVMSNAGLLPAQLSGGATSAEIRVNVQDNDGVSRVWAVIRGPQQAAGDPADPVNDLPTIDLFPAPANSAPQPGDVLQWRRVYEDFTVEGTYSIFIYARDRAGNTSAPALRTLQVSSPLRRRAVIACSGPITSSRWPAMRALNVTVYEALRQQGYAPEDIYNLTAESFQVPNNGTPTRAALEFSLTQWPATSSTRDLLVCLIGSGAPGLFELEIGEQVSASELNGWITAIEQRLPGPVSIVIDACDAGSFIPALQPQSGTRRLTVASAAQGEAALFLNDGQISFSQFFWGKVRDGATVAGAFSHAVNGLRLPGNGAVQTPQLDDNGNGQGNDGHDGAFARDFRLGMGAMLAGDEPLIAEVDAPSETFGNSVTITANGVTSTRPIARVYAMLTPPGGWTAPDACAPVAPMLELVSLGNQRFRGIFSNLEAPGTYEIAVFAEDVTASVSLPATRSVIRREGSEGEGEGEGEAEGEGEGEGEAEGEGEGEGEGEAEGEGEGEGEGEAEGDVNEEEKAGAACGCAPGDSPAHAAGDVLVLASSAALLCYGRRRPVRY